MLDFLLLIQDIDTIATIAEPKQAWIPLLMAGISAASSIAGGVSAAKAAEEQAARAATRAERDETEAKRRLAALRRGELDTPIQKQLMSQATVDALGTGMSRAAEDEAAEAREQALATAAMGGTPMSALSGDAYGDFARDQAIKGLTSRRTALKDFGSTQEGIQSANVMDFNTQLKAEMGDARRLERMGIVGQDMAEDARQEALRQKSQAWVQGMGQFAGTTLGAGYEAGYDTLGAKGGDYYKYDEYGKIIGTNPDYKPGMFSKTEYGGLYEEGGLFEDPSDSAAAAYNLGSYYGEQIAAAQEQGKTQFDAMLEMVRERHNPDPKVDDDEVEDAKEQADEKKENDQETTVEIRSKAKGGKYKFRDGGGVMVTDGEFDHGTNKKAIVDEETGVKEGEMTGQEALVFNDEQVATIEELTNAGDEKGLLAFMRELLSRPEFQGKA
jgi:hypothetical protein